LRTRRRPSSKLFPYTTLFRSNFNIIDEDDAKAMVRKIIKDLNLDTKSYKANAIRHKISLFKHLNIDYFDNANERLVLEKYTHELDRKSTRLNSSHVKISYAVF